MTELFVLETGEYSDHHIIGVFSTMEKALEMLAYLTAPERIRGRYDTSDVRVKIWTLDPGIDAIHAGLHPWIVWMKRDGTVTRSTSSADYGSPFLLPSSSSVELTGLNTHPSLEAFVWAKDAAHAIKIVNERRVQLIAADERTD